MVRHSRESQPTKASLDLKAQQLEEYARASSKSDHSLQEDRQVHTLLGTKERGTALEGAQLHVRYGNDPPKICKCVYR